MNVLVLTLYVPENMLQETYGVVAGRLDRTSSLPNGPEYRTKYWKMIDILIENRYVGD
jgi:hypothetical protein